MKGTNGPRVDPRRNHRHRWETITGTRSRIEGQETIDIVSTWTTANELIGNNYSESEIDCRIALTLAEWTIQDPTAVAQAQYGLGMLFRLQGQVANALDLLVSARDGLELLRDERTLAGVLIELGLVLFARASMQTPRNSWSMVVSWHARQAMHERLRWRLTIWGL